MGRKYVALCMGVLCGCLVACRSTKDAVPATANPYLTHYLTAVSDSTSRTKGIASPSHSVERLNKDRLHEEVDPEKEGTWADFLRHLVEYLWSDRR